MPQSNETLKKLTEKALKFRDERDWQQFHSPKNLAEGLTIEAAELMENFLWKTPAQSEKLNTKELQRIKEEIGDIFLFTIYLCNALNIDLFDVTSKKIDLNKKKYPIEKAKGNCKKYTEYE